MECKNCNRYSNEVIFEDIYIELEYLMKSYIFKVPLNNRDDFNQELLSVLYRVLQVFELKNNIDYEKVKSIKISKIYNIDDIIKIYDNKYFNAFVSKYKPELYEIDFQNINNIDLLIDEFNLFCNENQFIKCLNISLKRKVDLFNSQYRKEQLFKPLSLNIMIMMKMQLYMNIILKE